MKVAKSKVVTLEFTLKDDQGHVIETSDRTEPIIYLHGYDNLIPGLEKALENRENGDSFTVTIPPEQGYGLRDERLVMVVDKSELGIDEKIEIGMELEAHTEDNMQVFYVTAINGNSVTLDGNHPLSGITLVFSVKVTDIRDATKEEIKHEHVHGDGHHSCE